MRLSFAEAGLAGLDALQGVEAACLFVFEDERPLRGLAGYVDWRLCGELSRILQAGRFVGSDGDALLFPVRGGLCAERIYCFGAGKRSEFTRGALALAARRACQALSKAGVKQVATELPALKNGDEQERARTFLSEGATSFKGDRVVLFGDAKALARSFLDAASSMKGLEVDREPLGTARLPETRRG